MFALFDGSARKRAAAVVKATNQASKSAEAKQQRAQQQMIQGQMEGEDGNNRGSPSISSPLADDSSHPSKRPKLTPESPSAAATTAATHTQNQAFHQAAVNDSDVDRNHCPPTHFQPPQHQSHASPPKSVSFPPGFVPSAAPTTTFDTPQQHVLHNHQNPYTAALHHTAHRRAPHNLLQVRGGGVGAGRAIRTPHRVPSAHEMDESAEGTVGEMNEDDWQCTQAHPFMPPGHSNQQQDVVDLTDDSNAAAMNPSPDVEVLSHTVRQPVHALTTTAGGTYDPFGTMSTPAAAAYDPFAYNPFSSYGGSSSAAAAAAPAAASSSSSSKPLSANQFASLSKEQQSVILAIQKGENIFFSGCAGTGKSYLLKLLAQFLPKRSTFFTASTGLAAVNIGGSTLHSFAGVGLGDSSAEQLGFKARGNKSAYRRWMDCKVLIIDEISMIAAPFFDKLEAVARFVRRNDQPFGGIQLVLSGDFLQLPPVKSTKPTFHAQCWATCIKRSIVLTKVFRQEGDPFFINLLSNLREGKLMLKEEAMLKKAHYNQLKPIHGILPTKLHSLKRDTNEENEKFLDELKENEVVYFEAQDTGRSEAHVELLKKNCPAPQLLKLKKGAQVMLLKNLSPETGLCNGSRGIVVDFVIVHADERGGLNMPQLHTAEGSSDRIGLNSMDYIPDEKNIGFAGTTVAPETEDGENDGSPSAALVAAMSSAGHMRKNELSLLPRVQFDNGLVQVIESDKWEIVVQDQVQACRRQIPLTLAWALTIHKSQGMTLERAEINAQGMFENGQLYVAVSRVKSLQGLRLLNFSRDSMRTDYNVVSWYQQLIQQTDHTTKELLAEVDNYFPDLQRELEQQKQQNIVDEAKRKEEEELKRAGPFAQAAANALRAATAAASIAGMPPTIESPTSPSKPERRKTVEEEIAQVEEVRVSLASSNAGDATRSAASFVKASSLSLKPLDAAPNAFRSPLKQPKAAAIATAMAAASMSGEDVVVDKDGVIMQVDRKVADKSGEPAPSAATVSNPNGGLCCCCTTERADYAIFGCKHVCLCHDCHSNFKSYPGHGEIGVMQRCPLCQQPIERIEKMFL